MQNTDGYYAINLGDSTNNWVGSLARLYADQSTSKREELLLLEWLIKSIDWLCIIKGNHDLWTGTGNPIDYLSSGCDAAVKSWQAKIRFQFPSVKEGIKLWASHDFPGHSMYNPNHSMRKADMMSSGIADIYVAGHKHNWAYQTFENGHNNKVLHFLRARGL